MKYFKNTFISLLQDIKSCDDERIKKNLNKALRRVLQHYTELQPRMVSVKAQQYNNDNKCLNLQVIDAFDKNKGLLTLEHTTPIMSFINDLLEQPEDMWITSIENYSGCCWITKEQDEQLNKKGFKTKRKDGWKKSYELCEIILVD